MLKNDVKSKSKSKSRRKPLGDISNGVEIVSKSVNKRSSLNEDRGGDDVFDRLLLVHSDISTLIHQIDELVVQALKSKVTGKKGRKEIESFANVLSEMQSSLKPWVPRFQRALSSPSIMPENELEQPLVSKTCSINEDLRESNDSPDESKMESLVSPSPLVCWRAESTTENGRQLFMLTPLPRSKTLSSKALESSKLVFEKITSNTDGAPPLHFASTKNTNDNVVESVVVNPVNPTHCNNCDSIATKLESTLSLDSRCVSPTPCKKNSYAFALTPCLKMSPPKSCVLLEPASEVFEKYNHGFRKSTPFPVGHQNSSWFQDSESSGSEVECPKIFEAKPSQKLGNGKKANDEEWSNWSMSPPKTCILMEPSDEKLLNDADTDWQLPTDSCVNQKIISLPKKSCNQETESTPMWKEAESGMRTGRLPGENTLKKELWTKFEAATASGIRFNVPVLQATAIKGFLDRLEEASCDEASPLNEDPR